MSSLLAVNDHGGDELEIPEIEGEPTEPANEQEAVVWGFMGGNGGAGVTTLCVQLAYELSQGSGQAAKKKDVVKRPRVCLFDLDFENGACASYLDTTPKAHIEDLLPEASFIDRDLTQSLIANYSSHLDLLAVPNSLNGNDRVDPDKVLALLDNVCQLYEYVILDIPRLWRPWTHAAIGGSDQFYFVSELTVPSLQLMRQRLSEIASIDGLEDVNIEVIINNHERRSFRNSLKLTDAEKATDRKVFFAVTTNVDATREAINRGEPVGVTQSESRYAKDSRELLNLLLKEAELSVSNAERAAL